MKNIKPQLIILYGASCSGKTSVGEKLAEMLPDTAYISLDIFRRFMKNGLVSSFNFSLEDEKDKAKQSDFQKFKFFRKLNFENALLVIENFVKNGINVVAEGFEKAYMPGTQNFAENFGRYNTFTVHIDCCESIIEKRWAERHCTRYTHDYLNAFRLASEQFDYRVDSGTFTVEENVSLILKQIKNRASSGLFV